jgi:hypothetical protein
MHLTIKMQLSFKEYAKLLLTLTYRKPVMILLITAVIILLVWIVCYHAGISHLPEPTIYQYFTLFLICLVQPIVIYSTIWKNYHSSNLLKEQLEITFTETQIKIRDESFYAEYDWQKIYRVYELKNWYLIYQNNLSAITIPKKAFEHNEWSFISLLKSIPNISINLKNKGA